MCGIIGITADPKVLPNIVPSLVQGLKRLEYRGYDSAGFALVQKIEGTSFSILVLKDEGKIDDVVNKFNVLAYRATTGIAHTRWATHGPPSRRNAHPHIDCKGVIAVVHNGIIKNFMSLRTALVKRGHIFRSDTDTEVIPHILEELTLRKNLSMIEALRELVRMLEGSYAIAIVSAREPGRIYFAKKLSPLIIGVGKGFNIVTSDIPSLLHLTRNIIVLEDGEYGYISPWTIYVEKDGKPVDVSSRVRVVPWSAEEAEKGGYPHFMLKEIMEQPRALRETYYGLLSCEEIAKAAEMIANADQVYVTGAGTSYHASMFFALYMSFLAHKPVTHFIASEAELYAMSCNRNCLLIAVSQSGETIDTLTAVRLFRRNGARVVAVSNVIGSAIPRESDVTVYTRAGPEIGVAATKTFLTQLLALQLIAIETSWKLGLLDTTEKRRLIARLEEAPQAVEHALASTQAIVNMLALKLKKCRNMYVLSRHLGVPLAYEGALKIKEISYLHAEAYPAGESKHGPISLVEPGYPVIFVGVPLDDVREKLRGNIMEMKARGAITLLVATTDYENEPADLLLDVGKWDVHLFHYAVMPPLQLLAYKLAVTLGYDPDKPRNLAKTVTVE